MKNTLWLGVTLLLMGLILALYLLTPERSPGPLKSSVPPAGDRVITVKDGDTVVIAPAGGGKPYPCRLYGIDTPETPKKRKQGQPYGQEAADELSSLVLGKEVKVLLTGDTTYNRQVGTIEVDGVNVNLEMVRRGYAWAYVQYLRRPHVSEYREAEEDARRQRLGLWQDHNPVPPWEFRKRQRLQKLD
ncbi:thermonuclease family protein [Geobacter sulfurreducens]|jgi:micrococcal nuclease|uniref:Nuclease, putative n=1 Tax=Geobacter sulfurreducens (strain ATCC 51573 / DSM 12127 / PCA) TaxID=243231 RepID=Q74DW6_GEOSL|nr:thermonuclease family protein [Geobacter sulfurreducens]AAR34575.1 nuclease, putative [Geobacter sulfurreducens PCA]ADI84034.1 nuclease, putative [Geobacter sulfurreducens KN400]AJY70911.1 nuclease [Geobacter sulfurreducens]QVW36417.1 thermonuclease family protein [Geobacter sulfurreducens]UAC05230.1 thermonuclease family protein [Geobacter sulfurreducens]